VQLKDSSFEISEWSTNRKRYSSASAM